MADQSNADNIPFKIENLDDGTVTYSRLPENDAELEMLENDLYQTFAALFQSHTRGFYFWNGKQYVAVRREITLDDFKGHLFGCPPKPILGIPILETGNCYWACMDPDRKHEPPYDAREATIYDFHSALAKKITELKLPLVCARSTHGRGAWLYIFFKEKEGIPAAMARRIMSHFAKLLNLGTPEIFPKQKDKLEADKLGSGVGLPYCCGAKYPFEPVREAFGTDGEPLYDFSEFVSLALDRRVSGRQLDRDIPSDEQSAPSAAGAAPQDSKFPSMTIEGARGRHTKNLQDLRDRRSLHETRRCSAGPCECNTFLNNVAFFAGQAFAAKVFEASEKDVQNEIVKAAEEAKIDHGADATISSGWKAGLAQPISILTVATAAEITRPDMPESVLCGQLGQWCRERMGDFAIAYAWPAILSAASVMVKPHGKNRCSLFTALVGPPYSGKTESQNRANFLFNLEPLGLLLAETFGSAEGMLEKIGDRFGSPVLFFAEELSHLMEKAQIQGASFPYILNTLFYSDRTSTTVKNRKQIAFNARITMSGGVVEANFGDSFGSSTTAGLYSRFIFGLCPSGFSYSYRPMEGPPLFELKNFGRDLFGPADKHKAPAPVGTQVTAPTIHPDVWDARDKIQKEEGIDGRLLELCIRTALICGAWDGLAELRASCLGPAWELARYQQRVRQVLQPNPGRNFDGIVAFKILGYLAQHGGAGRWFKWRDVLRATHAYEYGPHIAERALSGLVFSEEVEQDAVVGKRGHRTVMVRLAGE